MGCQVEHDASAGQFTALVDGHRCDLQYRLANDVMTITHTGVPEAVGGRGIGSDLMRAALAMAQAEGWRVSPACSFAQSFLQRHTEYDHLRA